MASLAPASVGEVMCSIFRRAPAQARQPRYRDSPDAAPVSSVSPACSIQRSNSAAMLGDTGAKGARVVPTGTPRWPMQCLSPAITPPRSRMEMRSFAIPCARRAVSISPAAIACSMAT